MLLLVKQVEGGGFRAIEPIAFHDEEEGYNRERHLAKPLLEEYTPMVQEVTPGIEEFYHFHYPRNGDGWEFRVLMAESSPRVSLKAQSLVSLSSAPVHPSASSCGEDYSFRFGDFRVENGLRRMVYAPLVNDGFYFNRKIDLWNSLPAPFVVFSTDLTPANSKIEFAYIGEHKNWGQKGYWVPKAVRLLLVPLILRSCTLVRGIKISKCIQEPKSCCEKLRARMEHLIS